MKKILSLLIVSVLWCVMIVTVSADTGDTISYPVNLTVAYPAWDVIVTPLSFSQMAGAVTTNFPTVQNNTAADIRLASLSITTMNDWQLVRTSTAVTPDSKKIHWVAAGSYDYTVEGTTKVTLTPKAGTDTDTLAKKSTTTIFSDTRTFGTPANALTFATLKASSLPTAEEGTYQIATMEMILVWA